MKTLAFTLLLIVNSFQLSFAQNDLEKNQIELSITYEDGVTILNWVSAKEVNTSYYLVEKNTDGANYDIVSKIKAGSSTYKPTNYTFEDEDGSRFANYKVTLVLMDGNTISTLLENTTDMNIAKSIEE